MDTNVDGRALRGGTRYGKNALSKKGMSVDSARVQARNRNGEKLLRRNSDECLSSPLKRIKMPDR